MRRIFKKFCYFSTFIYNTLEWNFLAFINFEEEIMQIMPETWKMLDVQKLRTCFSVIIFAVNEAVCLSFNKAVSSTISCFLKNSSIKWAVTVMQLSLAVEDQ